MPAKDIKWSGGGDLVAIIGESSFYVLRYEREAVEAAVEAGAEMDEDGIEEAFELQTETSEAVRTGLLPPRSIACLKQDVVSPSCSNDGFRATCLCLRSTTSQESIAAQDKRRLSVLVSMTSAQAL